MSIGTILLIVLSLLLVAVVPDWPYARSSRYLPAHLGHGRRAPYFSCSRLVWGCRSPPRSRAFDLFGLHSRDSANGSGSTICAFPAQPSIFTCGDMNET